MEQRRDKAKEAEFLNSEVDLNKLGTYGDDALIRAIVYDLPSASEVEAKALALELQRRLRGDASIEANPAELQEVKTQIMEEAVEIDKAAEDWETDKARFIEDVIDRAPKFSELQKEKLQIEGQKKLAKEIQLRKAGRSTKQLRFKEKLAHEPLEQVAVTGRFVRTPDGMRQIPEVVSVMGFSYTLQPGVQEVPRPIAQAYKNSKRQEELRLKQEALFRGEGAPFGMYEAPDLAERIVDLQKQYMG